MKEEHSRLCKIELPGYIQHMGFKFLDELPLTPIGKMDYRALEESVIRGMKQYECRNCVESM